MEYSTVSPLISTAVAGRDCAMTSWQGNTNKNVKIIETNRQYLLSDTPIIIID